ncbi:hypothetical protein DRQ36_11360, partial [bacterium]
MKRRFCIIVLSILIFLFGCKEKYRVYSVAIMDRSPGKDYGTREIENEFIYHGVRVITEEEVESTVEPAFLSVQYLRLCAAYRADRADGAVALGKKLGVDAIVYSTMPPLGMKDNRGSPCMVDSLIAFYLVDPEKVIIESDNYDDFIVSLYALDWESMVKPLPPPEEFVVSPNEEIEFAGLKIRIEETSMQTPIGKENKTGKDTPAMTGETDTPEGQERKGISRDKKENIETDFGSEVSLEGKTSAEATST